jgi:cytochrome c
MGATLLTAAAAASALASPELARKHGCTGCHAVDQKVVGPSFADVADRYRNIPAAAELMAKHIRSGVSGVWGPCQCRPILNSVLKKPTCWPSGCWRPGADAADAPNLGQSRASQPALSTFRAPASRHLMF